MDAELAAPAPAAVAKNARQTLRDMVLFSVAAATAFGLFWYAILTVFDLRLWRETQAGFAGAAICSALACALVHEFLFFFVPVLETRLGGRVVYRPVAGTPVLKRSLFALLRDEGGGIVFLGLGESAIAALPATGQKVANAVRVTASFILGFALWYGYMEWLNRTVSFIEAHSDIVALAVPARLRTALNVGYKFCAVFLVSYTSRFVEYSIGKLDIGPAGERFLVAFASNFFFIVLWFRFYDLSNGQFCRI